ncbi:MAG: PrsW family intramembrane metalloprotease [Coriobacteriales bacterium]|nr:PrsW family intramembrane metalloprotease [Coriobacteriales bacterium]
MNTLIFIAALPVIALLIFVYVRDIDKEPHRLLLKLFLFGCLTTVGALILELAIDQLFLPSDGIYYSYSGFFMSILLGVALVEEGLKWIVVFLIGYKSEEFNHHYDAIVYAVFVSLGFALVENIEYVFAYGASTGIVRGFTAIPCHACNAMFMGYFFGRAKTCAAQGNASLEKFHLAMSIIVPTFTHGVYDFLLMAAEATESTSLGIASVVYMIVFFAIAFWIVNRVSKVEYNFDGTPARHDRELPYTR